MHIQGKVLPIILALTALFVESCAAFFSVYGLSKLFAGSTVAIIVMASSLEIAKVVTASFLYQKWKTISWFMKTYLCLAVVVLITITSMGIYGFLSNAFQSSTLTLEKESVQISLLEEEYERLSSDKAQLQIEKRELQTNLNAELSGLRIVDSTRYYDVNRRTAATKRYQPLINSKESLIQSASVRMQELSQKISELKVGLVQTGSDVGPIIYVARFFKTDVGIVVQYLIFIFIAVFDPLAVSLVIATNKAFADLRHQPESTEQHTHVVPAPKQPSRVVLDKTVLAKKWEILKQAKTKKEPVQEVVTPESPTEAPKVDLPIETHMGEEIPSTPLAIDNFPQVLIGGVPPVKDPPGHG